MRDIERKKKTEKDRNIERKKKTEKDRNIERKKETLIKVKRRM
jgi:hypothetical protein